MVIKKVNSYTTIYWKFELMLIIDIHSGNTTTLFIVSVLQTCSITNCTLLIIRLILLGLILDQSDLLSNLEVRVNYMFFLLFYFKTNYSNFKIVNFTHLKCFNSH